MANDSYSEIQRLRKSWFNGPLNTALHDDRSNNAYLRSIVHSEFADEYRLLPRHLETKTGSTKQKTLLDRMREKQQLDESTDPALAPQDTSLSIYTAPTLGENAFANQSLVPRHAGVQHKKNYHSNWKLQKVLLGHTGQVCSLGFDPLNKFFATGAADSTIKIWNLASSRLDLTLTGHIMAVRGIVISDRHPYMFSCSEDKTVKCWDLEKNRVVRDYHGHLSSVYSIDLHPTLDLIVTAGRDSAVRVWDIRTKLPVHTLTGHKSTVNQIKCRATDPQIVSSSMDSTVKTWDLAAGKCLKTLTYHSKSVRAFAFNEDQTQMVSGSSDGLRKFEFPECDYLQEMEMLQNDKLAEGNIIINTISTNTDGVMFVGCDNGMYGFWDWENGDIFQSDLNVAVPGSLAGESGIMCSQFDNSGLRLVTGGVDKSVKVWKQVDETASEASHE